MAGEICRIVAVANLTNITGTDHRGLPSEGDAGAKIAPASVLMAVKKIIGNAVSSALG
jgi:hypothetical protein